MKKLFKITLIIAINITGIFIGFILFIMINDPSFDTLKLQDVSIDFPPFVFFFLLYLCSSIFQIKTYPLYKNKSQISSTELLDIDIKAQQLTQLKKIKLNILLWISYFVSGLMGFAVSGTLIENHFKNNFVHLGFKEKLLLLAFTLAVLGIFVDMVLVQKMNKQRDSA